MSAIGVCELYLRVRTSCIRAVRTLTFRRGLPVLLAGFAVLAASPMRAQTFEPSLTIGAGIQTSYQHVDANGSPQVDQFSLGHARIYLSGTVTNDISVMFNTDYDSATNKIGILDAAGQFNLSPMVHIWAGRFLPPSDRANLYGPFYSNQFGVYTDGIQDGYNFVFQGRDNGVAYWGDFKAGIVKIKASAGVFDGASLNDGSHDVLWAGRVQLDFWDKEDGYYLNGTYYGDKNLLAVGGATQVQAGRTASTVDFVLEKKVMNGGAFSLESELSDYNHLGGYNGNYAESEGVYGLASFLFPKAVGMGKFQVLGKYATADFTEGAVGPGLHNPSYRQQTTEVNVNYVIKEFDARVMSFYRDARFNRVMPNYWEAGIGLQLQISKTIH